MDTVSLEYKRNVNILLNRPHSQALSLISPLFESNEQYYALIVITNIKTLKRSQYVFKNKRSGEVV